MSRILKIVVDSLVGIAINIGAAVWRREKDKPPENDNDATLQAWLQVIKIKLWMINFDEQKF